MPFPRSRSHRHRRVIELIQLRRRVEAQALSLERHAREIEEGVEEHHRALAELEKLQDEFIATISHELRTPLTAIVGWARLLRAGRLDKAAQLRAIESIERNARAQTRILDDLLDASRITGGHLPLEQRPADLGALLEEATRTMLSLAKAKGVTLEQRTDPALGPVICDAARIQQVICRLVSNAIKFTPPGGKVTLALDRRGPDAVLSVHDTGDGIHPDFLPHLFDRFRQESGTRVTSRSGLGLGLSIVRHVIEQHGGSVHGQSEGRGSGATFEVRLPIEGAPSPASTSAPSRAPTKLRGCAVLLVEDDVDARELMALILEQSGARVTLAGSLSEALRALDAETPDVLLCDIGLPGGDGYALLRAIRGRPAERGGQIPAAALTGYARSEDRQRSLDAGFQAHLTKPIDPSDLTDVIASLVAASARPTTLSCTQPA